METVIVVLCLVFWCVFLFALALAVFKCGRISGATQEKAKLADTYEATSEALEEAMATMEIYKKGMEEIRPCCPGEKIKSEINNADKIRFNRGGSC